jgi:hypothetical protein
MLHSGLDSALQLTYSLQENYGRAKETYSHTQSLWEKEIRRARKETFKSQSSIVKLQEELKAAKAASRSTEEILQREKERSKAREEEAFSARYQLVGIQEQLEQALERAKVIEQERDAFKTLAQNEEVARIAAEGRLPLPQSEEADDEFASPRKTRISLTTTDIVSSATSEAEIEDLTRLWQWERQRADRAQEHAEFLEAECHLGSCPCVRARPRHNTVMSARKPRPEPIAIIDAADFAILGQQPKSPEQQPPSPAEETVIHDPSGGLSAEEVEETPEAEEPEEPRRNTVYLASEGIFRTLSQQDLEAMEIVDDSSTAPPTPVDPNPNPRHYARTPSVDPPAFAVMVQERTSLLSLLNAPRQSDSHSVGINIPTTPANVLATDIDAEESEAGTETPISPEHADPDAMLRPHTSAAFYTVTTTTTVPIREVERVDANTYAATGKRAHSRTPSFDITNPALTPTMTREQALAQIKERRGRARSAAQGAMTPRKQMVAGGGERRDVSAPASRTVRKRS